MILRLAFAALLCACGAGNPVTIAVILGPVESDGARLAYEEAVAAGLSHPVDTLFIIAVDTRAAPAIRVAERITGDPRVIAVVGPTNSAASLAAAPVYNENKVVQLSPTATAVLYSAAGPYSYRLSPPDDRQGRFIAEHVMKTAAGKRVALMYVNDDYGRGLRREVMRAVRPNSIDWVMDAPHIEGLHSAADKRVASLVQVRPEMIVWLGRGAELEQLLPDIRARLGGIEILGSDGVSSIANRNTGGVWDGIRFVDMLDLDGTPGIRAFRQRYHDRFGRNPSTTDVLAYDAMKVLIAAVESGARTGSDVRQFMDELGRARPALEGAHGLIRFDENGDVDRSYVLTLIDDEQ